ncbi:hypothetical protein EX895_005070 [Sporisorium graminicola]|uniref:TRIP4/RQT4 C2HC5-type zinc finger domain-containing protein n=1 Tax=Sporisorium graminicola TaxID=280036 RepID=A0A4U7KP32_9BASI|nr:hypothetical protein EX895_005070 [Sporisorium graminicola]TKY86245.1 hypothetical protein EX895_005070 [Sporisorium graminicola]
MAKGSSIWNEQLVSLLGLDKETVKTQILPFLDSFDDEASLRTHLQGLVGTDTTLAKSFVRDFTRSRFPQQASASGSTTPTLPVATTTATGTTQAIGQKKRAKKTLAERAGIGQTLSPRKVQDSGLDGDEQMSKLSEAFGGMGTVYRKKQDEDDFFAGMGKGKKAKQLGVKQASSGSSTPRVEHDLDASAITDAVPVESFPQSAAIASDEPPTSMSALQAKLQPSPPPTAAMLAIDAVVEELTSTSASTLGFSTEGKRKMCFCQGRRHALAPHAPLCYSCGLILCSAIQPSPLSPLSSCPSCSASPLLGAAARSDLIAKLSAERDILLEQQLLQIQLQREARKLNKATARSAKEEEAALFPKLGMEAVFTSSSGVPHAGPVMGKHGALQKAKTIASDAQRTAKVLSLDMKTHKVKTHTKVTRPKPAVAKQETASVETEVDSEEENDPFVGVDGSTLVKNDADDGLRAGTPGKAAARAMATTGKAIPTRSWTFAGSQLTLRPITTSVQ